MYRQLCYGLLLSVCLPMLSGGRLAAGDGYYASTPAFHASPDPDASSYKLKRFGPVGIGLDLPRPNFTMHITNVEVGSPGEACGQLKKGQISVSMQEAKLSPAVLKAAESAGRELSLGETKFLTV